MSRWRWDAVVQKLCALLLGIARVILYPCVSFQQLGKTWRNGLCKVQPRMTECLKQRLFLKERRGKSEDQVSTCGSQELQVPLLNKREKLKQLFFHWLETQLSHTAGIDFFRKYHSNLSISDMISSFPLTMEQLERSAKLHSFLWKITKLMSSMCVYPCVPQRDNHKNLYSKGG